VAVVQYTFTRKLYTEYGERNNYNKTILVVWAVPRLCELYPGIFLTTGKNRGNPSVRVVEKCPDIPVAVVQYTFSHKLYTEYGERKIHNKTILVVWAVPRLWSYNLAFALQRRQKRGKPPVRVAEKCPDIPVAARFYHNAVNGMLCDN
jgi:hypothetical protein